MERQIPFSPIVAPESIPTTVLVIDDDAMSRDLLDLLLQDEGYDVQSTDSGEAALALLGRGEAPPKLVLADCQMPGTSGSLLAGALRRACGPSTLLLAMSGSQPPQAEISGFDGFLMKPFPIGAIAAALAAHNSDAAALHSTGNQNVTPPITPTAETASNADMSLKALAPAGAVNLAALAGEIPVLNETIFEKLATTLPIRQLVEMYTMCVNDARQRIALMRACVANNDSARFVREAHAIKGSCGMLGATQLHGMAAELEITGLEPSGSHSQQDVNSLDELSAACDRLERMLGSRVQA